MVVSEIEVFSTLVRKKGIFRLKELIKSIQLFFDEFKYNAGSSHKESGGSSEKNYEVNWTGSRKPDENHQFNVKVSFIASNVKEAIIEESNEKINVGNVRVGINGSLVVGKHNEKDEFKESGFLDFISKKYFSNIGTAKRQGQLSDEMEVLQMKVKKALDLFNK